MANANYQVKVKDHSGNIKAWFSGFGGRADLGGMAGLSYSKRLRTPGVIVLPIYAADNRVRDMFLPDGADFIVEIERRDLITSGSKFYRDFSGFHRGENTAEDENGNLLYTSYSQGLNVLLVSEEVAYPANSSQAYKSMDSALAAYEFVDENIGLNAGLDASGASRIRTGFSLNPVANSGKTWEGGRSYENLYDVLDELADYTPAEFMVENESPLESGTPSFVWYWRNGFYGKDLRPDNSAGNRPVTFSSILGTATGTSTSLGMQDDVTTVYALGQGVEDARKVIAVNDSISLALSPWSRRAVSRNWSQTNDDDSLQYAGEAVIEAQKARYTISFGVSQTEAIRYGIHWNVGDIARFEDRFSRMFDIEIVGVNISLSADGKENISIEAEIYNG